MPDAAASHALLVAGWRSGMISAIRVAQGTKSFVSHRKSSKKPCSVGERRNQCRDSSSWQNDSWRIENNPVHPGIVNDMDPSSLMTLCHSLVAIERCMWGMESSIFVVVFCGSPVDIVLLRVSINQLRMILLVVQHTSPFLSFWWTQALGDKRGYPCCQEVWILYLIIALYNAIIIVHIYVPIFN